MTTSAPAVAGRGADDTEVVGAQHAQTEGNAITRSYE